MSRTQDIILKSIEKLRLILDNRPHQGPLRHTKTFYVGHSRPF